MSIHHSMTLPPSPFSVLFVCTNNLCASPIAAALFRRRMDQNGKGTHAWRIESAGTWAKGGQPACQSAQQVMCSRGIDLKCHHSRIISEKLLAQFNLVLTMDEQQKTALGIEFPQYARRMYMLSEMAGQHQGFDISQDPDMQECELLVQLLNDCLALGEARMRDLACADGILLKK